MLGRGELASQVANREPSVRKARRGRSCKCGKAARNNARKRRSAPVEREESEVEGGLKATLVSGRVGRKGGGQEASPEPKRNELQSCSQQQRRQAEDASDGTRKSVETNGGRWGTRQQLGRASVSPTDKTCPFVRHVGSLENVRAGGARRLVGAKCRFGQWRFKVGRGRL